MNCYIPECCSIAIDRWLVARPFELNLIVRVNVRLRANYESK